MNVIALFALIMISQVTYANEENKIQLIPKVKMSAIILNILSQYPDYSVIIHFDNKTSKDIYVLIGKVQNPRTVLLLNYDRKDNFSRPIGYKFLNIILLTDAFYFSRFSNVLFNLEFNDVILLLTKETPHEKVKPDLNTKTVYFWQQKGFERAGSTFVLDVTNNDLYHECFYCGQLNGVLKRISTGEEIPYIRKYMNNYTDFHGQVFKIGYMTYLPFFWCRKFYKSECKEVSGPEGELLKLLSTILNFRYSLKNFKSPHGGEWKAMVQAVHYRRIDWAIGGISSSTERGELTDLTKHIHIETYTTLFYCCSSKDTWKSWKKLLLPFKLPIWLCIGSMLLFMSLLLRRVSILFSDEVSIKAFMYFEIIMRGLVDQAIPRKAINCLFKRFLLISWWYFAIIITTAYRSKLASTLIYPNYEQPSSIQELYQDGYYFQADDEDWSVLKENLESSVDSTYRDVLKKINDKLDTCSAVNKVVKGKVALINEESTIQYQTITYCHAMLDSEDLRHLRVTEQEVFPSYHIWPMQLAAPYRNSFTMTIENLHSTGILKRWYDLASKKRIKMSNHQNEIDSASPLELSTMLMPIIILAIGLILASVVFACEIMYFTVDYFISFYEQHNIMKQQLVVINKSS